MRSVLRATAPASRLVHVGGWAGRVGPWREGERVAHLVAMPGSGRLDPAGLSALLAELAAAGWDEVLTSALAPVDQDPYLACGFASVQRLHLLECAIGEVASRGDVLIRRPRRAEWTPMAGVDRRAFDEFWRLDERGIAEAMTATPASRLRVAVGDGVLGYAVTGRSGRRGFVQRLAVDPAAAGRGIGGELLRDGLRWLRARGATSALVNTQVTNDKALALYRRHGFETVGHDLCVLGRSLGSG